MQVSRGGIVKICTIVVLAIVVFGFGYIGSIIPRASATMFASPDETATAIFADSFGRSGAFRVLVAASTPTVIVPAALHPRSMLRQGDWLVPVGFLGMPFLAWLADTLSPHAAPFLTLLLVLSSLIPLYFLVRPLGRWAAWSTLAIFASFPTVLLYENRGLFPNLPVVALTIWSVFLLKKSDLRSTTYDLRTFICAFLGGLTFVIAAAIRPFELIWMLPWAIWALFFSTSAQEKPAYRVPRTAYLLKYILILLPIFLISIGFTLLSMRTYPYHSLLSTQPAIGYFMKDNGGPFIPLRDVGEDLHVIATSRSISSLWAGIHPRVMWHNASVYLGGLLGPWIAISVLGVALFMRKRTWTKRGIIVAGLSAWTVGVLFFLYGQTLYADNINQTATLGNSFLRYMLPLAPLIALGCGLLVQILRDRTSKISIMLASACCFTLVVIGCSIALTGDAESILPTRNQILKYVSIRNIADTDVPPGAIIFSERNDKIFASGLFTAVSPLPDVETLKRIASSHVPAFFYHRRIKAPTDVPPPMVEAFHQNPWVEVFTVENEAMYRIDGVLPPI